MRAFKLVTTSALPAQVARVPSGHVPVLPAAADLSRRSLLAAVAAVPAVILTASSASAKGLDTYVKRKQLDPLETYVPPVLAAKDQLALVEGVIGTPLTGPDDGRRLLRNGAFGDIRAIARAIGQYAVDGGKKDSDVEKVIRRFFKNLEGLDSDLLVATRAKGQLPDTTVPNIKALSASIDELLSLVPAEVLARAQVVYDSVKVVPRAPDAGEAPPAEAEGPELKALEKLLK